MLLQPEALGSALAREGDETRAGKAWSRILQASPEVDSLVAYIAFSLAAISALLGDRESARKSLQLAREPGADTARASSDALSDQPELRRRALAELSALVERDTDAQNFIGIVAFLDGDPATALKWWTNSALRLDGVAPLLIKMSRTMGANARGAPPP